VLKQDQIQRNSEIELCRTPPDPPAIAPGAQEHPWDRYAPAPVPILYSHFHQAQVCEHWLS